MWRKNGELRWKQGPQLLPRHHIYVRHIGGIRIISQRSCSSITALLISSLCASTIQKLARILAPTKSGVPLTEEEWLVEVEVRPTIST